MSFKFHCPENFKKKLASWFVQKLRKTLLGSRLFGFKTMKVNNSESGLQYFIQKMAQYIIFKIKLITMTI